MAQSNCIPSKRMIPVHGTSAKFTSVPCIAAAGGPVDMKWGGPSGWPKVDVGLAIEEPRLLAAPDRRRPRDDFKRFCTSSVGSLLYLVLWLA